MTFWDHLDQLRGVILRCIVAVMGCGVVVFCLKEWLFSALLWPMRADFPLWKLWPLDGEEMSLINTELTQQFIIHIEMSLMVGALLVLPYLVWELVRFVSPALYPKEKRAAGPALVWGILMFLIGVALAYWVIFPLTYRFLSGYQVDSTVGNLITLRSYISTLLVLSVMMGVVFELPIVCSVLARLGLLTASPMRRYRKHAIVAILIVAAIITPTGDAFTLTVVSLPIYLLYEASILVVRHRENN